jgi:hypothetical protein
MYIVINKANEDKKIRINEVIREIYSKQGIRGFFRGFYFNIVVGSISNLLFFNK